MMKRALPWLWILVVGCGPADVSPEDGPEQEDAPYVEHDLGELKAGLTVGEAGGCNTAIVSTLTRQLIEELNCMGQNTLVRFDGSHTDLMTSVTPYLALSAARALKRTTQDAHEVITLSSAYRSAAQQALLWRWWHEGRCGIQLTFKPGKSNHQSGRSLDVPNYTFWKPYLKGQKWTWFGSDDRVHYDFLSAPNISKDSVRAFQRLWNRNHRSNKLLVDGVFGPVTSRAMDQTPVKGFSVHGCSAPLTRDVMDEFPDAETLAPSAEAPELE